MKLAVLAKASKIVPMRAYRLPYPPKDFSPPELATALQYRKLWTVDFPDRHVSYTIVGCKEPDLLRCVEEVRKSVGYHAMGQEPRMLEIRLLDTN